MKWIGIDTPPGYMAPELWATRVGSPLECTAAGILAKRQGVSPGGKAGNKKGNKLHTWWNVKPDS